MQTKTPPWMGCPLNPAAAKKIARKGGLFLCDVWLDRMAEGTVLSMPKWAESAKN